MPIIPDILVYNEYEYKASEGPSPSFLRLVLCHYFCSMRFKLFNEHYCTLLVWGGASNIDTCTGRYMYMYMYI